ncbi:MAG: L-aspartate oxidase [Kineosporiaceae bacterium]|nr:L-aspartate oxidase [Kineosporiaceae bacterium]
MDGAPGSAPGGAPGGAPGSAPGDPPAGQRVIESLACEPVAVTTATDVLIVGSGIAGLALAQALSEHGLRVDVVTKARLREGSTRWAQGGVATADGPGDDPSHHLEDTLIAGAGLCDADAVKVLVEEGPSAVAGLLASGAVFDRTADGALSYTLEGGHSRPRIVHAGGDATGLEIQRTLESAVMAADDVQVWERTFLLDLLRDADGGVVGARVSRWTGTGHEDASHEIGEIHARATVLATGGYGQVFAKTSNPWVATGDGLAAALRAGAVAADLEFVQFHPTVLALPAVCDDAGRHQLVSEAVRGEGAVLIDGDGARVMAGKHPREDLAPRDVVAATMAARMAELGVDHLYLDARHLGEERLLRRFPTIVAGCRAAGVDPVTDPIPVAPAAHYACGGLRSDMSGRTSLPGLYAVGEVACTGVHGANRLASNSLLEAMVVARRLARLLLTQTPLRRPPAPDSRRAGLIAPAARDKLTEAMVRQAGVVRRPDDLDDLAEHLDSLVLDPADPSAVPVAPGLYAWEVTNLHTIATALVAAARAREESRGCHRRSDLDGPRTAWRRRVCSTVRDGRVVRLEDEVVTGRGDAQSTDLTPTDGPSTDVPPAEHQPHTPTQEVPR